MLECLECGFPNPNTTMEDCPECGTNYAEAEQKEIDADMRLAKKEYRYLCERGD